MSGEGALSARRTVLVEISLKEVACCLKVRSDKRAAGADRWPLASDLTQSSDEDEQPGQETCARAECGVVNHATLQRAS